MTEPTIVKKRAIDVTPYVHGIWCTVSGSKPFVNEIATRRWTADGAQIQIMLESHNFDCWKPEELVDVVEIESGMSPEQLAAFLADDAKRMANRPGGDGFEAWRKVTRLEYPGLVGCVRDDAEAVADLARLRKSDEVATLERLFEALSTDQRDQPASVVLAEAIVKAREGMAEHA